MIKIDFKKEYKEIYKAKKPNIVSFPSFKYVTLEGEGNPNEEYFSESIGVLYAISYTISMSYKGDYQIPDFHQYVVPPLEGVWTLVDESIGFNGNKDNLKWTIMIMLPDFVTEEVFALARKVAFKKKKGNRILDAKYEIYPEKECCVYTHIGSYDNEPASFRLMEDYVSTTGYKRSKFSHREIYLNDFRKVEVEKLKTVLCFEVKKDD